MSLVQRSGSTGLMPRATTIPAPFSYAPSQAFMGNDGSWSTFFLQVGTPGQVFQVLPSTSGQETWVPVPEGCLTTDPNNCGVLRGVSSFQGAYSAGFQTNKSSTWVSINLNTLDTENRLAPYYQGNGQYGFESVGLGLPNTGGLSVTHSIVAGIAAKSFYLGALGLGPKPTNFSTYDTPQPSLMWLMKNQSMIPSLSYSYTAGASYQGTGVAASLILGGYDRSKFTPNSLSFPFNQDDSYSLTVGLQSIVASNTLLGVRQLLDIGGIFTLVDSTVPELWLPNSTCDNFAAAFGLTYDRNTDRYLVNNTIHTSLKASNPTLTFALGTDKVDGSIINIKLPYAAFDLQASYPIYPNATNYFPIRRSLNQKQYTLGRTFLQEAYLTADYERQNFSISQVNFTGGSTPYIIPILPPTSSPTPIPTPSTLSTGALVGIILGSITLLLLLSLTTYLVLIRRRRIRKQRLLLLASSTTTTTTNPQETKPRYSQITLKDGTVITTPLYEHYGNDKVDASDAGAVEMSPDEVALRSEMESPEMISAEIIGHGDRSRARSEMPGGSHLSWEMDGEGARGRYSAVGLGIGARAELE